MNRFQLGLLLCALSAVLNVDGVISLAEEDGPPAGVGIGSAVVALATFAGIALALRGGAGGRITVTATRVVSALALSLPAFFIGAPAWVYATAGTGIALTVVGVPLLWLDRTASRVA